eukprot:scaffold2984_cov452-Prasinococcus_capsulatus_cf.AAC.3
MPVDSSAFPYSGTHRVHTERGAVDASTSADKAIKQLCKVYISAIVLRYIEASNVDHDAPNKLVAAINVYIAIPWVALLKYVNEQLL